MNDYEQEGSMIATIVGLILVIGVGVGGGLWYFFYREGKDPFKVQQLQKTTSTNENSSENRIRRKDDINDDGAITAEDVSIVASNIGCTESDDCWDDVIGKTLSGDNPIYVSDLDVNSDGEVNDQDLEQVNAKIGQ